MTCSTSTLTARVTLRSVSSSKRHSSPVKCMNAGKYSMGSHSLYSTTGCWLTTQSCPATLSTWSYHRMLMWLIGTMGCMRISFNHRSRYTLGMRGIIWLKIDTNMYLNKMRRHWGWSYLTRESLLLILTLTTKKLLRTLMQRTRWSLTLPRL